MGFFIWFLCAVAAAMIGSGKGRCGLSFFLGLLFGPFGILFALCMTGNRRDCPSCKSKIHAEATVCPMCRSPLAPASAVQYDEITGSRLRTMASNGKLNHELYRSRGFDYGD
jgi:hypothetical protein